MIATASKTADKTSQMQREKRKRDDANEAVKALLRTKAKEEEFDLVESFQTDDGTVLELELQTRKGSSSYYKGVTVADRGIDISDRASRAAGVTKRYGYETEVDAAKAIALAKHESD